MSGRTSIAATNRVSGGRQESSGLPVRSIGDLITEAPAEPPWLWDGFLLPGAITLLGAKPKAGKSCLMAALLPRLAAGELFLDRQTRPTRAFLLSEEGPDTLIEKATQFGVTDLELLCYAWVANRPWYGIIADSVAYMREHGQGLLIVDTLNTWAGLRGDAENQAGAVLEIVEPLRTVAAQGFAVLVIVHHRKSGGDYGDAIRGSSALAGAVDVVIDLQRSVLGDNARELHSVSRFRATPPELVAELDKDEGRYRLLGDAASARAQLANEEIIATLERLGECRLDQLAGQTGIPERTLRRKLDALGEQVERTGSGVRNDPYRYHVSCQPPQTLGVAATKEAA